MQSKRGFTLLEILIALFIFTILSFMLAAALRTVINAQSGTENKALRLRELQMALLVMSRDIEQAVNRPIVNADGKEEGAFIGSTDGFQFTHTGFANPFGTVARSTLQRTGYSFKEDALVRTIWPVLDQAPQTKAQMKRILMNVTDAHFQYLDHEGHLRDQWPMDAAANQPLPRGVRIYLTLAHWGKMTQLYLIPVENSEIALLGSVKK